MNWSLLLKIVACLLLLTNFCICQNTAETVVRNPAFQNVAPCPCDLTSDSCDLRCCCDGDCSSSEKSTFDYCIAGLPGGQDAAPQDYKCSSNHFYQEDWFPLLCVVFEYNAFLGYFYEWQLKIGNNTNAFLQRLASVFSYSYREQEIRQVDDSPGTGYQYGVSLKTGKLDDNDNVAFSGILSLPQPTLAGQCLQTAPVRFLKDIDTSCTFTMTNDLCGSNTPLSSLFYAQSSSLTGSTKFFSVLEDDDGLVIAETNVAYLCASDASAYLRSDTVPNEVTRALFDYTLPTDPNCTDSCGNDICIDVNNLVDPDPPVTNNLPGPCNSQNPEVPNNNNGICENAVVEVQYTITWERKKLVKLDANIILANIALTSGLTQNVLTQKYVTKFVHNFTGVGAGATDNFENITDRSYARSGRVGYDIGKPVFSGSVVSNDGVTPPEFLYVNTNSTRQMAVFNPGADGLCINATKKAINFGEDLSTGCTLRLTLADFNDCSGLRKLIINRLNALMPSDVLGRRGYNDVRNSGYWLNVLRDDLSVLCIASEYYPVGKSPVDNRTGICRNITSGIHLDILYAETGRSNGFSIYEILGGKVSYTTSTWEVKCGGPGGSVCDESGSQSFLLTSSVRFTRVPPQTPEPVAKYYETPEEDDRELCPGDRCWDNLMYPLSGRYIGMGDSKEYVFAMVCSAIVFFIGYLLVTRPFW